MSTQEMDKKINAMLLSVKKQREEVEKLGKTKPKEWQTNTAFKYGNALTVNLKIATKQEVIQAMSDLLKEMSFHKDACDILGLKIEDGTEFEYQGYQYSLWVQDLKKRLIDIDFKVKKEKLEKAENVLKGIMSEDQKREEAFNAAIALLED